MDQARKTLRAVADSLARLPLVLRCVVIGWLCAGTLGALYVMITVPGEYSLEDVVPAMLFGMAEAFVFAGLAGGCVALVAGLLAQVVRGTRRKFQ